MHDLSRHLVLVSRALVLLALAGTAACALPNASPQLGFGPPEAIKERLVDQRLQGLVFERERVRALPMVTAPVGRPLAPEEADRALRQASDLLENGRSYEALELLVAPIRSAPERPLPYYLLARALRFLQRTEHAEAAYRTALDLDPRHLESRHELAGLLQAERKLDEAMAEWQTLLGYEPDYGSAHARLAALHFLLGDRDSCEEHRAEAKRLGTPLPSALAASCEVRKAAFEARGATPLPVALPPTRVDAGAGNAHSAETILAAGAGPELVAGWIDLRQGGNNGPWKVAAAASLNGGGSWSDQVLHGPFAAAGDYEGDPMVAHDPRTGTQWVGGILFGYVTNVPSRLWVARRQAVTANFLAPVQIHGGSSVSPIIDKGLLAAGPRPGLPNSTRLYVTYNLGIQRSDDLGATWSAIQSLPSGLGFQPKIGANGVLYVLYWDFGFEFRLVKSTDGGATFGSPITVATRLDTWGPEENNPRFPGGFRVAPLAYMAVNPTNGVLTMVYPDTTSTAGGEWDVDLYLTRSTNGGTTWSTPVVVGGDSTPPRDQFHPWIEADSTGRLHLAFFDTRNTAQADADTNAWIDLYYATSEDDGLGWGEMRITNPPFQSALAGFSAFQSQFVGDYIGLAPIGERVHVLYPSTSDGHLHVYAQILDFQAIFADGFESGNTSAWSTVVP